MISTKCTPENIDCLITKWFVYEIKLAVLGTLESDPRLKIQVDPAQGAGFDILTSCLFPI